MSNPKRQHWVPKAVLKFFENENEQVYFFDKTTDLKRIEPRNRKSVFWARQAYTLERMDGSKNYSIEHQFAKEFDDKIGELVFRRLVLSHAKFACGVSSMERAFLHRFIMNIFIRNPITQRFLRDSTFYDLAIALVELSEGANPRVS